MPVIILQIVLLVFGIIFFLAAAGEKRDHARVVDALIGAFLITILFLTV